MPDAGIDPRPPETRHGSRHRVKYTRGAKVTGVLSILFLVFVYIPLNNYRNQREVAQFYADPTKWAPFAPAGRDFQIVMPADPTHSMKSYEVAGVTRTVDLWSGRSRWAFYDVSVCEYFVELNESEFEAIVLRLQGDDEGRTISSRTFRDGGLLCQETVLSDDTFAEVRRRIVLKGSRLYVLTVRTPSPTANAAYAARFLGSFKLVQHGDQ